MRDGPLLDKATALIRAVADELDLLADDCRQQAELLRRDADWRNLKIDPINARLSSISVNAVRAWALREHVAALALAAGTGRPARRR
jgi:hypothetical protein